MTKPKKNSTKFGPKGRKSIGTHLIDFFKNHYTALIIISVAAISITYIVLIFQYLGKTVSQDCPENPIVELLGMFKFKVKCDTLELNEVGDYLAGLISLLATFWLMVAFIWQAMELAFQRSEFKHSNRIAEERAHSEKIWREVEFYDRLREKLKRTVNECRILRAELDGEKRPEDLNVISDLMREAEQDTDELKTENLDQVDQEKARRFNHLLQTNKNIARAIRDIEADEQLEKYIELIK